MRYLSVCHGLIFTAVLATASLATPSLATMAEKTVPGKTVPGKNVITALLKPELISRIEKANEVISIAKVKKTKSTEAAQKKMPTRVNYDFFVSARIGESLDFTRGVLKEYGLYAELVPFVSKTKYTEKDKTIQIEGGIFNYVMKSVVKVTAETIKSIHFEVIEGHLKGLKAKLLLEPSTTGRGTLVYFGGDLETFGATPPVWILEKGAEIVLSYTAKKMRSTVEARAQSAMISNTSRNSSTKEKGQDESIPRPRKSL